MGIDGTRGIENMSGRPMGEAQPVDSVIKGIKEEISEVRRQRQQLSSKEDLPAGEKVKKRQELQQKISDLNRELRQRQAEVRKEQQKDALAKEGRAVVPGVKNVSDKDAKTKDAALKATSGKNAETSNAKTGDAKANEINELNPNTAKKSDHTDTQKDNVRSTSISAEKAKSRTGAQDKALQETTAQEKASQPQDFDIPPKKWKAVVESDTAREQIQKQEAVIARIEGGIAVLKSEIKLDEARGADVEKKQEELKKETEKLQKASAAQFTSPNQNSQTAEKAAPARADMAENFSPESLQPAQPQLFKDLAVSLTI